MKIKIENLMSKKSEKEEKNTEAIYCTKDELDLLWEIVASQIEWQEDGCLIDGEEIDEKKMSLAKSLLKKI